jgi:hypothetical protein
MATAPARRGENDPSKLRARPSACSAYHLGISKIDPCWRVIARFFAPSNITINAGRGKTLSRNWVEQQMIDAKPGVTAKRVPPVIQNV